LGTGVQAFHRRYRRKGTAQERRKFSRQAAKRQFGPQKKPAGKCEDAAGQFTNSTHHFFHCPNLPHPTLSRIYVT
jgi:hypothetical protein